MKIFIAGASGLVGGNCMHYFKSMGMNVVGSYFSYPAQGTIFFDTLNPENKDNFDIKLFEPDVIIHCGALTHVDYCEQNEAESYQKTVESTQNLVTLSKFLKAKLVFISTDYIFDGKNGPYLENATPNPLSLYGVHKLKAEEIVKNQITDYLILRITNVYGDEERGKNFVSRIIDQAKNGQKLTLKLPIDQYATPINAFDIARTLFLLLKDGKNGIYNIASTDYMNRVQLAQTILKYYPNAVYDLIPMLTKDMNQPADRPLQGGLKAEKFLNEYPNFQFSNVDDYVAKSAKK